MTAGRIGAGLGRQLFKIILTLAVAALIVMTLATLFQVIARYIFDRPPFWTEELARYAMIWAGTLGAVLAFWRGADPFFTAPGTFFPSRWRRASFVIALLPPLIFSAALLFTSLSGPRMEFSRSFLGRNLTRDSEGLQINMAFVAASVPLMALLVLLIGLSKLIGLLRGDPLPEAAQHALFEVPDMGNPPDQPGLTMKAPRDRPITDDQI